MEDVMKKYLRPIMAGLLCAIFIANIGFAKDPNATDQRFTEEKLKRIEKNLVLGMESSSPSLQASAALVLKQVKSNAPEYGFTSAIIPLMRILKDEQREANVRIAAALSLQDLKSERGDFAIQRTAQFADSPRVKHICSWLTYQRLKED
jgi:HEAT repeat protein